MNSKIYFNIFKQIGNLRLMFVISCIFGIISLFAVTQEATRRVYYYSFHTSLSPQEYNQLNSLARNTRLLMSEEDLGTAFQLLSKFECTKGDIAKAEQTYLGKSNGESGCKELDNIYKNTSIVSLYSFSYLWNYLWLIFWFYLPFIIVMPIKFIVDGYNKDKKDKR